MMEIPGVRQSQARRYAEELAGLSAPGRGASAGRLRLLRALDQVDELGAAFAAEGIGWVLVKGVGLSLSVWPDPFLRSFSDLDVFVVPSRFAAAVLVLARLGYHTAEIPDDSQVHWTFYRDDSSPVELHHVFSREFGSPPSLVERFVATGVPVPSDETGVLRVPDPAAHLAYVLLHAYNHGFQLSPGWALDVFFMLERHPECLAAALAFFPREWPVCLGLRVAALVVPALADALGAVPAPTLRERALLRVIALRFDRGGLSTVDSALLRVLGSPTPLTTLGSMVSRYG
ncbi:nucleotidyltransferase family protein [Myxococcota bacterium]|nr:nucleotidyltransferase family protein [Myxococcota bacterium]